MMVRTKPPIKDQPEVKPMSNGQRERKLMGFGSGAGNFYPSTSTIVKRDGVYMYRIKSGRRGGRVDD